MIDTVKTLLFRSDGSVVVHECRRCGATLESADDVCPACDTEDVASFEIR